jgi:hypothetical protein
MMVTKLPTAVAAAFAATLAISSGSSAADSTAHQPRLLGRAVLPVETYAPGPPSGTLLPAGTVNGITFPLPSQPVEGFSAIIAGRHPGEYLAMPDNGFGAKTNSADFLIRAYYIRPDFKLPTAALVRSTSTCTSSSSSATPTASSASQLSTKGRPTGC